MPLAHEASLAQHWMIGHSVLRRPVAQYASILKVSMRRVARRLCARASLSQIRLQNGRVLREDRLSSPTRLTTWSMFGLA